MIVTVGNPTFVARPSRASCRAGEEARSQVRRAARNARRGREHDAQVSFRFCLFVFVILPAKTANSVFKTIVEMH
jgi:hypothetical protein